VKGVRFSSVTDCIAKKIASISHNAGPGIRPFGDSVSRTYVTFEIICFAIETIHYEYDLSACRSGYFFQSNHAVMSYGTGFAEVPGR
jgi:hypothetical protein